MANQKYDIDVENLIIQLESMSETVNKTMNSINRYISTAITDMNYQFSLATTGISTLNNEMNGFDTTQKMITSSIGLASSTLGSLSAILNIVKEKQSLLNLEILKNPYVLAATAITALVAGIAVLASSMSDEEIKHRETMDAINAEITARNDLHAKQQESLTANLAEVDNISALSKELETLVGANGEVSEADRSRASFITSVLNEALGTQIKMEEGVLTGYDNASSAIDNKIAKLKAEAILEAQLPAYKEALINATNAQMEADRLESELSDIKIQKKAKEAELIEKYGENWIKRADATSSILAQELRDLEGASKTKEEEYNTQNELVKGYYDDISLYETNAALIASDNAENYAKVQMESAVTKATSVEEKKLALEAEMEAEQGHIEHLRELRAMETDAEKQQQLDNQIAAAELKAQGFQNELDGLAEQGEKIAEAKQINDLNELTKLQSFIESKQAALTEMYATDEANWTEEQRREAEALKSSIDNNLGLYAQYASDKVNKAIQLTTELGENATEEQKNAAAAAQQEAVSTLQILEQNAIDKLNVLADLKQRRETGDKSVTDSMIAEATRQADEAKSKYGEVASNIKESWEDLPEESQKTFEDVMNPMLMEMEKKEPVLFDKASGIAGGIIGRLKKSFDIHSPSKKVKQIFQYVMEGAEVGLTDKTPELLDQTEDISQKVLASFAHISNEDLRGMARKMQAAVNAENLHMQGIVNSNFSHELYATHSMKIEIPEIKGTIKGNIENHVEIDGRETAIQLTPFISQELAFQHK